MSEPNKLNSRETRNDTPSGLPSPTLPPEQRARRRRQLLGKMPKQAGEKAGKKIETGRNQVLREQKEKRAIESLKQFFGSPNSKDAMLSAQIGKLTIRENGEMSVKLKVAEGKTLDVTFTYLKLSGRFYVKCICGLKQESFFAYSVPDAILGLKKVWEIHGGKSVEKGKERNEADLLEQRFKKLQTILADASPKSALLKAQIREAKFNPYQHKAKVWIGIDNNGRKIEATVHLLKDGTIDVSCCYDEKGHSFEAKTLKDVFVQLNSLWKSLGGRANLDVKKLREKNLVVKVALRQFYAMNQEQRLKYVTNVERKNLKDGTRGTISLPTSELEADIGAQSVFPEEVREIVVNGAHGYRRGMKGNFYTSSGRYLVIYSGDNFEVAKVLDATGMKALQEQMRKRRDELLAGVGASSETVNGKRITKFAKNSLAEKFLKQLEGRGMAKEKALMELQLAVEVARDNDIDPKLLMALREAGTINGSHPESEYVLYGRYVANAMHLYSGEYLKQAKNAKVRLAEVKQGNFAQGGRFTAEFLHFSLARLNLSNAYYATNNAGQIQKTFRAYGLKFDQKDFESFNKKIAPIDRKTSRSSIKKVPMELAQYSPELAKNILNTVQFAVDNQLTAAHCWDWCYKVYRRAGVPFPFGTRRFFHMVNDLFRGNEYLKGNQSPDPYSSFLPEEKLGHLKPGDWIYYKNYWRGWPSNYNPPYENGNHSVIFLGWKDQARGIAIVAGHARGRSRIHTTTLFRDTGGRRHTTVTWVMRPKYDKLNRNIV